MSQQAPGALERCHFPQRGDGATFPGLSLSKTTWTLARKARRQRERRERKHKAAGFSIPHHFSIPCSPLPLLFLSSPSHHRSSTSLLLIQPVASVLASIASIVLPAFPKPTTSTLSPHSLIKLPPQHNHDAILNCCPRPRGLCCSLIRSNGESLFLSSFLFRSLHRRRLLCPRHIHSQARRSPPHRCLTHPAQANTPSR